MTKSKLLMALLFSSDYFSPVSHMGEERFTENTYSVHHFNGSWYTPEKKSMLESQRKIVQLFGGTIGKKLAPLAIFCHEVKNNGLLSVVNKIKHKVLGGKAL